MFNNSFEVRKQDVWKSSLEAALNQGSAISVADNTLKGFLIKVKNKGGNYNV